MFVEGDGSGGPFGPRGVDHDVPSHVPEVFMLKKREGRRGEGEKGRRGEGRRARGEGSRERGEELYDLAIHF